MSPRPALAAFACLSLWTSMAGAADFSSYRGFRFLADLAATAKQAGVKPSEAMLVHRRPALIQELEWRPALRHEAGMKNDDPVRDGLLRFYNDELFQIVITYDADKVEGMTEADMVDAIPRNYGAATKPGGEVAYHSNYGEVAAVLARWENPDYSCNLIRTGDRTSCALILSAKRLDGLARAAIAEAGRLDALEAPQKAIDLQKKQEAEIRLVLDKARAANVANFRP